MQQTASSVTFWPSVQYALISQGTTAPDWPQPHRPIRVPFPGNPTAVRIEAHQWVQDVLEPWQLAAAVSLVVPLPSGAATDDHRTVIDRLTKAKRLLQVGKADDLKASVAATREATEVLRTMRPATVKQRAQDRDLASEKPSFWISCWRS